MSEKGLSFITHGGIETCWDYRGVMLINRGGSAPGVYLANDELVAANMDDAVVELEKRAALGGLVLGLNRLAAMELERPVLQEKLRRPDGLCTSIARTDEQNAARIKVVLDAYLGGTHLQSSARCDSIWHDVLDLPQDFVNFRFRVAQP